MARGYKNLEFKWNNSASTTIKNLGFGRGLNKDAAEILYRYSYEYIPFSLQPSMGSLANKVRISANDNHGTITHLVSYAKYQYNADAGNPRGEDDIVHRTRAIHPLATSHWSDWAWSMHKKEITQEIDEARLKYRKFSRSKSK